MPESLTPVKKMVPIPLLNEDKPKYSGGFKLRIAQMWKYYATRFSGGQFFLSPPEHSFHAYELYSTRKSVPIPLLNEDKPKYSGGFKLWEWAAMKI
jgi:hypothetical protein